jgi:hypothetical protein
MRLFKYRVHVEVEGLDKYLGKLLGGERSTKYADLIRSAD